MKLKKILVTGGAGYIGSHTVVELAAAGYDPVILDNFSNSRRFIIDRLNRLTARKNTVYEGDCTDCSFVKQVFKREKDISGVIHFVALKAVHESVQQPLYYYRNNLGSLLTILEIMAEYKVSSFVFSSSCTLYGNPDRLPVREDTVLKEAECPYGATKRMSERIIEDFIRSLVPLRAISLRYFNPIGAHPSALLGELPLGIPKNLVPLLTQTAIGLRKVLTVYGDDYATVDGTCVRDYVHVLDLARAHVQSLSYLKDRTDKSFYDVFNIGTGHGNTVMEVIRTFERITGQKLNYKIGPRRPGDVDAIYANVDKANKVLPWKAKLSLENCLRDAWEWEKALEANPEPPTLNTQ